MAPDQDRSPSTRTRADGDLRTATKLISASRMLAFAGLPIWFLGAPAMFAFTDSFPAAMAVACLGLGTMIAGAVVGHIGRTMRGRTR